MKKMILAMMTAAVLTAAAMSASAEVFTTTDGVMSVETPEDESWAVVVDPKVWFTITDGKNIISVDHLSNGENLPQVLLAGDDYKGVSQSFISTKNEVFVIKALAAEQEDLEKLLPILNSVKILKYDTKEAVTSKTPLKASDFGLRVIGEKGYVTARRLNVRSGCSTDDAVLGELAYGEEVQVVAAVTKNGEDFGWYQIQFKGGTGYVAASFVADKKPEESSVTTTGKSFTVYDSNGTNKGKLTPKSDGYFYSDDNQQYKDNGNGSYYGVNNGETLYNFDPVIQIENINPADRPGAFMVWDAYGNSQGYLAPDSRSGNYYSNDNQPYVDNGDGSYYGTRTGDTLYDYDTTVYSYSSDSYYHELSRVGDGAYVYVTAAEEDSYVWVDSNGNEYQNNGDGTFTDYYGNDYDMID